MRPSETNPLLRPGRAPHVLPRFADIRPEHYLPALREAVAAYRTEIEAIRGNPEPPAFVNTAVAFERAGQSLDHVSEAFFNVSWSDATPEIQAVEPEFNAALSELDDEVHLDRGLYERFAALDLGALEGEDRRLVERHLLAFRVSGVALDHGKQERLRRINQELTERTTDFSQALLEDTNASPVLVDDAARLAGLPEDEVAAAREAAREAGRDGYLLTLSLPTEQPALKNLTDRRLRWELYTAALERGRHHRPTAGMVADIVRLRAEKARLLGFDHHAAEQLVDQTAPSVQAVRELLGTMAEKLGPALEEELGLLRQAARRDGVQDFAPWDVEFYAEKVRAALSDIDAAALKPYFELERVLRDGVFFAAERLYGLTFTEVDGFAGYHPEVRCFEVREADGSDVGLFLFDPHARPSKRGGAWMNHLTHQSRLLGHRPVVVNNLNMPKPPVGSPVLLTYDELRTLFHEFGHALHGLLSDVGYPSLSGTNVPRDFVEYPSQVNEMWILWPEVIGNYARHHGTGEPLPAEVVERLRAAASFGEAVNTSTMLGASILDLAWHSLAPEEVDSAVADPAAFERRALEEAGVFHELLPPRYRTLYFSHIFGGGYSAGYYSYLWSEILDAHTVDWFTRHGGLNAENGRRFRKLVLSRGDSVDPVGAFREFTGEAPDPVHLLRRRGLLKEQA